MKRFVRNKEDFKCKNCGFDVTGTGYTNHCPKCLWSKHVDVFPGDRLEVCCGMMRPINSDKKKGQEILIHKCVNCGKIKNNILSKEDNYDTVIELAKHRK